MAFSTKVDAAGAIGHGVILVELLHDIGDEIVARIAVKQGDSVKDATLRVLEAGEAYSHREDLRRPIAEGYPETVKALTQLSD
ncbi:MAG: hypothetical protein ABIG44_13960 [Planctomycetota bacterium]